MAYIRAIKRKDGTITYCAQVFIKKNGVTLARESKTFARKRLADEWAKRREIEVQKDIVYGVHKKLLVSTLIEMYMEEFPPTGRSKRFDLNALMKRDVSALNAHTLTHRDLVAHIRDRNKECKPQTAQNDLIWLKAVVGTMRGVVDLGTDMGIFETARLILKKEGLVAKSNERERLPTKREILRLSRHLKGSALYECFWFALYSARRLSEITRLEWGDLDHEKRTCNLRGLKDPRKKGVNKVFKLPRSAYKVIIRQPKVGELIFPYNPKTIGNYFSGACKLLGIGGLHFHDLRHAATTNLFNKGLSIQQVQQVTLHSTWASLSRYCNMDPGDLDI